ncbi:hypothetical protein ETH_00010145, partial [Eimeria tenella]
LVEGDSCLLCPGGFSCLSGVLTPCEKFFSFSLPGDLRCRPCPPGFECTDTAQPPTACPPGHVVQETLLPLDPDPDPDPPLDPDPKLDPTSEPKLDPELDPRVDPDPDPAPAPGLVRVRRCGPCPPHSACAPGAARRHLGGPTSRRHLGGPTSPLGPRPTLPCHSHFTDPACPPGGLCWAGKFFPCPEGQQVSEKAALDTSCSNFAQKCEPIPTPQTQTPKPPAKPSSPFRAGTALSLRKTEKGFGNFYTVSSGSELRTCAYYSSVGCTDTSVLFCHGPLQLPVSGHKEIGHEGLLGICNDHLGVCETGALSERACPPGRYLDSSTSIRSMVRPLRMFT